jgi:hypothetical protein
MAEAYEERVHSFIKVHYRTFGCFKGRTIILDIEKHLKKAISVVYISSAKQTTRLFFGVISPVSIFNFFTEFVRNNCSMEYFQFPLLLFLYY